MAKGCAGGVGADAGQPSRHPVVFHRAKSGTPRVAEAASIRLTRVAVRPKDPNRDGRRVRKRVNQRALDEDEGKPSSGGATEWFLGDMARNKGSIHSDVWVGTAADLAERGVVGIFPVSGWWKDQPKRDRSNLGARYALVISIETEAEDVDIWTPVAQEIGVAVEEIVLTT